MSGDLDVVVNLITRPRTSRMVCTYKSICVFGSPSPPLLTTKNRFDIRSNSLIFLFLNLLLMYMFDKIHAILTATTHFHWFLCLFSFSVEVVVSLLVGISFYFSSVQLGFDGIGFVVLVLALLGGWKLDSVEVRMGRLGDNQLLLDLCVLGVATIQWHNSWLCRDTEGGGTCAKEGEWGDGWSLGR